MTPRTRTLAPAGRLTALGLSLSLLLLGGLAGCERRTTTAPDGTKTTTTSPATPPASPASR